MRKEAVILFVAVFMKVTIYNGKGISKIQTGLVGLLARVCLVRKVRWKYDCIVS